MKKAFTLAEVLITLAVIGVVAALTVPALINNSQKSQYVSALKKGYLIINEVITTYSQEEGCMGNLEKCDKLGQVPDWNACETTTIPQLSLEMGKYFKTVKTCEYNDSSCGYQGKYKDLQGGVINWLSPYKYIRFYLSDGMIIYWLPFCICSDDVSSDPASPFYHNCGEFYVDVNGEKNPNQMGRDMFYFQFLKNGKVYPGGSLDDQFSLTGNGGVDDCLYPSPTSSGFSCGSKVLQSGSMNY